MKDTFVLLVLLSARATLVCSQSHQPDSNGNCLNATEYWLDGSNLCCKKCQPGQRMKEKCSRTNDTKCEQCPPAQFMEGKNFSPKCFSCNKCKSAKGLLYVQHCSSTTRSKCGCRSGMYCILEFDDPYCAECSHYTPCKVGYGVSVPERNYSDDCGLHYKCWKGTANSDVKCQQCREGTFSDTVSDTDRCRPYTNCLGRAVVGKGNSTSDTVCEPEDFSSSTQSSTKKPHTEIGLTTLSTTMITVSASKAEQGTKGSTVSIIYFRVAVIASAIGVLLVFITIILLFLRKTMRKKEAAIFDQHVDDNGNCERGDKVNQGYLGDTQLIAFTVASPEQQCLLEKGANCSDLSQRSHNSETLIRGDGCSDESIGPLQSTSSQYNPHSALSEPTTLLSDTEPPPFQTSIPTQSSSQPTSPQVISPMTTSPQVNVNITFHLGNGSSVTPSVMPTDTTQIDSQLPFGEEEESFSIPQQEAGKQSLMSVQESA